MSDIHEEILAIDPSVRYVAPVDLGVGAMRPTVDELGTCPEARRQQPHHLADGRGSCYPSDPDVA